jgi:hypothetical protein
MDKVDLFEALCVRENSDLESLTSNQLAQEKEVLSRHGQRVTNLISTCVDDAKKRVMEQQRAYLFKRIIAINFISRRNNLDAQSSSSGDMDDLSSFSDDIRRLDKEFDEERKEQIRESELRRQEFLKKEQEWKKESANSHIKMQNLEEKVEKIKLRAQLRKEENDKHFAEQMKMLSENAKEAERQEKMRQDAEQAIRRRESDERIRQIMASGTAAEEVPNRVEKLLEEVRIRVEQKLRKEEEDRENARLQRAERRLEEEEALEITRLQIAQRIREEEARLQKKQTLREVQEPREQQQLQREQESRNEGQRREDIPIQATSRNIESEENLSPELARVSDASQRDLQLPSVPIKSKSRSAKASLPPKVSAKSELHRTDALDKALYQSSSLVTRITDWFSRKINGVTRNERPEGGMSAGLLLGQSHTANEFSEPRQPPMHGDHHIVSHEMNVAPVVRSPNTRTPISHDAQTQTQCSDFHDVNTGGSISRAVVKWQKPSKVRKRAEHAKVLHADVVCLYVFSLR